MAARLAPDIHTTARVGSTARGGSTAGVGSILRVSATARGGSGRGATLPASHHARLAPLLALSFPLFLLALLAVVQAAL